MNVIQTYGKFIKKTVQEKPERSWKMIQVGIRANQFKTGLLPNKSLAHGYQKLEHLVMQMTTKALKHPETYVWGNIFAPVELFQCFGLNSVSIECFASFLSGMQCEDYFIDYAQSEGIAPTLCSYHKGFIGAVDAGAIPVPSFAVTTSLTCDGNLNTFRYLCKEKNIDFCLLDIPYDTGEDAVRYVELQLEEMIKQLEDKYHKKLDRSELKYTLEREKQSKEYLKEFLELQKSIWYPGSLTAQLYMLFATHLNIGTKEVLDLFRFMKDDIRKYPKFTGKKILWVHLLPYYQETLKQYFNANEKYQVIANDTVIDYMQPLDIEKPIWSLAKKMVHNLYNGSYERKIDRVSELVDELEPDAVINFCHWGCKQSSGGSVMLKEAMQKKDIPTLILDGDAMDRRNSHDGQIKTRLEAFLELINEEVS